MSESHLLAQYGQPLKVGICIPTHKRPRFIESMIQRADICAQNFLQKAPLGSQVYTVIVDNDKECSAKPKVNNASFSCETPIVYLSEPTAGLSNARNMYLKYTIDQGFSYIALIDDDAIPQADWLVELVSAALTENTPEDYNNIAAVDGDNTFIGEGFTISDGFYLAREMRRGGSQLKGHLSEIQAASSNNLLLNLAFLRDHNIRFDRRANFVGGEDNRICQDIKSAGGKIIRTHNAKIKDQVTRDRVTPSGLYKRGRQFGCTEAHLKYIWSDGRRSPKTMIKLSLGSVARWIVGWAHTIKGLVLSVPDKSLRDHEDNQYILHGNFLRGKSYGTLEALFGPGFKAYENQQ